MNDLKINHIELPTDERILEYHISTHGATNMKYVLCFHGMTESRTIFSNKRSPFRLLCVDRPGYGGSSPPPSDKYSYEQFAKEVELLLKHENISSFEVRGVLGHSSGGPCALAVAHFLNLGRCILIASDIEYSNPQAKNLADPFAFIDNIEHFLEDPFHPDVPANELGFVTERELHELDLFIYREAIHRNQNNTGVINDYYLERKPWGFDLKEFINPKERLRVVIGDRDPYLNIGHANFFRIALKNEEIPIVIEKGYGHFDIILDQYSFSRHISLIES